MLPVLVELNSQIHFVEVAVHHHGVDETVVSRLVDVDRVEVLSDVVHIAACNPGGPAYRSAQ